MIEEKRIDNLTRRFSYNLGGHLTQVDETGYGERGERPQRRTEFERDRIGRLLARLNADARQDYVYDDADRLLSIQRLPTAQGKQLGVSEETLEFAYDLLGRLIQEKTAQGALSYEYDPLSNLTTLTLPTGQHLNHLYYGSGHLHQLNLDGQLISDIERDDLHREVLRTQGTLTSCFGYDALGRKSWQFASRLPAEKLSRLYNPGIQPDLLVEHAYNPIHRRHQYDPAGELTRTLDKLRGEIKYEYEANGQLHSRDTGQLIDSEEFRYDAAANRLNFNTSQFDHVKDTRFNGDRSTDLHLPSRQRLSGLLAVARNRPVLYGGICVVPGYPTAGGQFRGEYQSWFQPAVVDLFSQWPAGRHFGGLLRALSVAEEVARNPL
ncbi:hypothetical protein EMIT0P4_590001 [Pseudomonas sp. IT-P4]